MKKHIIPIALCIFLALTLVAALVIPSMAGAASSSGGGEAPAESELALPKEFGEPRSVQVSPAFGSVSDQLPLIVPPGRRSVEPHLMLSYSSMGGLGNFGIGWSLNTGYVEFWRGDGTPAVGNPDSYMFNLSGSGGQLINTGNGVYRAKIENVYREFRLNSAHGGWEMYNGEGALHRFGGTENSRIDDKQWMLDLVRDAHGNTITYNYERVGNALYVSEIRYTGFAPQGDPGANLVTFEYTNMDTMRVDYGLTVRQEKGRLVTRVSMFAGNQLARRYEFIYEANPLSQMPYLKEVTLVGADDTSRITLRKLEYGTREMGWNNPVETTLPASLADADGGDTGVRLVDVNGDGFVDMVTNDGWIYLGIGDGTFATEPDSTWSDSLRATGIQFVEPEGTYKGVDKGVRLMDVNSDGLADLFIAQVNRRQIYLNTGFGWSYDEIVYSGSTGTTGKQWSEGAFGLNSISAQAEYSNTTYVPPAGVYDDADPALTYNGNWISDSVESALAGTLHYSETVGNSATFMFHGTQLLLAYSTASDQGVINVYVDDTLQVELDEYSAVATSQNVWESPALDNGIHRLKLEHANGTFVNLDAAIVSGGDVPVLTAPPAVAIEPFAISGDNGDSKGVQLADVNADGQVDILWSFSRTPDSFEYEDLCPTGNQQTCVTLTDVRGVFLNTGTGWELNSNLTEALAEMDFFVKDSQWQGYNLLDVNGDGITDILRNLGGKPLEVRLGTGYGWVHDDSFTNSLTVNNLISLASDGKAQGLMPIDFNEDGLVDYLLANGTTQRAYLNTGTSWVEHSAMAAHLAWLGVAFVTSDGKGTGFQFVDMNGDGAADLLQSKMGIPACIYFADEFRSGLLKQVTSAIGEVTTLEWTVSTQFNNHREDGAEGLPGPMLVASALTRSDGRGHKYTTTFTYQGGIFTDRQFRGFHISEQQLPTGLTIISHYHQEEDLVGAIELQEGLDLDGNVRVRHSVIYGNVSLPTGVTQTYIRQSDDEAIDPGSSRHSRTINEVDDHLNYISIWRDPDLDVSGDESINKFYWAENNVKGIWSLLAHTRTFDSNNSLVLESITLYDGLPELQADKGLPTTAMDLVETGRYVTKSFIYNQYGNIERISDAENNPTRFWYDPATFTFRVQAMDAEGRVVQSEYDPRFGKITRDIDTGGYSTRMEYDVFGRLAKITLPGDETSPFGTQTVTYSSIGDASAQYYIVSDTENPGKPATLDSKYFYDGMGYIYRSEREASNGAKVISLSEYDDAGNAIATTRPFFDGEPIQWNTIVRDELYRPISVKEPTGEEVFMVYVGTHVDVTDARGFLTSYYRNQDGQTTEIHQWANGKEQVTYYKYDVLGQLTAIKDALGEETQITYNMMGQRTRLIDPNTGVYEYQYDNNGDLIRQIGPDGKSTDFQYDHTGNMLRKTFPDGSYQQFTYDPAGDLVQIKDSAGTLDLKYDMRGRITSRQHLILGKTYETRYAYDSLGRVTQVVYPDGYKINYRYDSGGMLVAVVDGQGQSLARDMTYNAAGQLLEIQYGNGVHSSLTYDKLLRMASINTVTGDQQPVQKLEYSYDDNGNILSIVDKAFNRSQTFEYDSLGRLTKATGAYGEEVYEYDAIGNLLRKGSMIYGVDPTHPQRVVCGVDISLMQGNANGIGNNPHANPCEILSGASNQPTVQNPKRPGEPTTNPNITRSFSVTYDASGNAVSKGGTKYEYDAENHLLRVRDTGGMVLAENVYDAAGQRIIQITPQETIIYIDGIYEVGKTHISHHVMAGPLLVASIVQPRSLAEASGGSTPNSSNALAGMIGLGFMLVWVPFHLPRGRKWQAGLDTLKETIRTHPGKWITLLFVLAAIVSSAAAPEFDAQAAFTLKASEKTYYYHSNHLGSVNAVTDERGKIVERREYKPFGESFDWTGPNSRPREFLRTFQGQYYDDSTGLYYMGARHYDPQIGRFLAADTQVTDPINPATLHRYAFAGGNPIRYVDPTGHAWWDFLIAGLIVVAAIALTVISCGILLGVGVALLALAAGAMMAIVAYGNGLSPTSEAFWQYVAIGMVFGAVIGAGMAALPLLALTASGATFAQTIIAGALVGAATGAVEQAVVTVVCGGGVEGLFGADLWTAIGWGALTGMIMAGIGYGFRSAASLLAASKSQAAVKVAANGAWGSRFIMHTCKTLGHAAEFAAKYTLPGMGAFFFAKCGYGAIASYVTGDPHKLTSDLGITDFARSQLSNISSQASGFSGSMATWWGSASQSADLGPYLQTMPFAP